MKKLYFTTLLIMMLCVLGVDAQMVYSVPSPLQQSSKDVKIYFNAAGTSLENQSASAKIYAHTGYETAKSKWNNAPNWGNNAEKYLLTNQGGTLWMLYIGDINTFYNVPSGTAVTGLDFVFRSENSSSQTEDLFLNVYDEGLQLNLTSDANGSIIAGETGYVKFTVSTTQAADITLSVDNETIATAANATSLEKEYTFVNPGEHTVTATAKAGDETATESLTFHYLSASAQVNYPGGNPVMGPVANADGSVTFCFGAPEKNHVVLVGSWNNYAYDPAQVMNYQETKNGKYFWTTVKGLDPEKMYMYYFVVDGGEYIVGDPYARLVLDPYNDKYLDTNVFPNLPTYPADVLNGQNVPVAVYQGNINDYDWVVEDFVGPDPSDLIIYELLFRDFTGTEGQAKGNGTVQLAIEKFDYLKQLGVNAIELLPIMEFNGNISWGYNPNFYFAVDKAYGTPDDYKEFIDLCHQNGMAVILDMVFNQSDGLHPWYQMYPAGKNPFYNLNAPHAYSVLNDWNQGMPMVQEQWADVIKYWMNEYKFDGFRFDLVKGLGLNESYANNGDAATNAYNASRVAEMRYLQDVILSVNPNGYCINENLAGAKEENEMAETGMLNWANVNEAACQFAMGYYQDSNMNRLYAPQDSRTWGSTISYLESHDEQRLAYKQDQWAVEGVKGNDQNSMWRCGSAAAQMIMAPGAHMIWQFSEMGNAQNTKNNDGGNNTDPKIVNWSLLENPYHKGLYDNYCQLIEVRLNNPEMFTKDVNFSINCNSSNWNNGRFLSSVNGDLELYTLVNPNTTGNLTMNVNFQKSNNDDYVILTKSYQSEPSFDASTKNVVVPANCYVVIGSASLSPAGVESIISDGMEKTLAAHGGYGEVVVDYAEGTAAIFSLDGKVIGNLSGAGSFPASSGLYIVKCGKDSVKVLVK
ncbi:MAG: hypothetical protein J1F67_10020 [Muribaculaceae bacterium]|nr:hypothetical protein [Muribaculaceae bacterium]